MAESDLGSYYNQQETFLKDEKAPNSTSASQKIPSLQQRKETKSNPDSCLERVSGKYILQAEGLQCRLKESVSCRFCNGDVELLENVSKRQGLGTGKKMRFQVGTLLVNR